MRTSTENSLSYRTQALVILAIVILWYGDWWLCRQPGERAPVVAIVAMFALPMLGAVLSYLIVDSRMRGGPAADVWFYVGLVGGLVPLANLGLLGFVRI